jgi:hypothetical protein
MQSLPLMFLIISLISKNGGQKISRTKTSNLIMYSYFTNRKLKNKKMTNNNYTTTIEVATPPADIFNSINDVSKWWGKEYEGKSTALNDEFSIRFDSVHYSKQKLIEVIPGKKVVWVVTDSKLNWLKKDKHEWTNTKMVFEITTKGDKSVLVFTHEGLVPEKECYSLCEKGWNQIIKGWLFKFITEGITI